MDLEPTQISKWEQNLRLPGIYNAVGLAVATGRMVDEVFFDYRKEWQERIQQRRKLLLSPVGRELMKSYSQRMTEK